MCSIAMDRNDISRRKILKGIGGGAGLALSGSMSVAASGSSSDSHFDVVHGAEADRIITRMSSTESVQRLRERLSAEGFSVMVNEANVRRVSIGGQTDTYGVIPLATGSETTAAFIIHDVSGESWAVVLSSDTPISRTDLLSIYKSEDYSALNEVTRLDILRPQTDDTSLSFVGSGQQPESPVSISAEVRTAQVTASSVQDCLTDCVGIVGGAACILGCGSCFVAPNPIGCFGCLACAGTAGACCVGHCADPNGVLCTAASNLLIIGVVPAAVARGCSGGDCSI